MDFVQQFLSSEKGSGVIDGLVSQLGITGEQAQRFVPAAVQKVLDVVKGGGLDLGALVGGGDVSGILSKIDVGGLASETGVDAAKASEGLKTVAPALLSSLKEKAGSAEGVLSLLGGGEAGGLLGAAGRLAGKLFKK